MSRRRVLVTGASRGIGKACALALARDGWDLVVAARTVAQGTGAVLPSSRARAESVGVVALPGSLEETASQARAYGAVVDIVAMDLIDRASVVAAIEGAGSIDSLVLAAIYQGPGNMDKVADLAIEDVEQVINATFVNQFALIQAALPGLIERGGSVVNITSFAARYDPPAPAGEGGWGVAYAAAKAAMHRVPGHLHVEFASRGLRAFNVDPGNVVTEMAKATNVGPAVGGDPPEPIGDVVAWLCAGSQDAAAWSGKTVVARKLLAEWAVAQPAL